MLRMPAEWEPHERTWMAWPCAAYALGDKARMAAQSWTAWAGVAQAVAMFEPVTLLVDPAVESSVRTYVQVDAPHPITVLPLPLDDSWVRDTGPTFVINDGGGTPSVHGIDWTFNGWGQQSWARWKNDDEVAAAVCHAAGVGVSRSPLVNEGGGIHVDGRGTALITETVQRDPQRNGTWTRHDVEAELKNKLGVNRVVWLPQGLTRDYDEFGTRGHVDIVACFAPDGSVLLHDQRNPDHPDHAVSQQIRQFLTGEGFSVVDVPAPATLRDEIGFVDYSYINHYVVNGGVIVCAFNDPHDDEAADIMARVYPGRQIVRVDARHIFALGGGIHCITQQQPQGI